MIFVWLLQFSAMVLSVSFSFQEKSRAFIHVFNTDGEAKYWVEPSIELAMSQGLSQKQLTEALRLVEQHHQEILNAWHKHFGS